MSKEPTLKDARKKFEERNSQIKADYERRRKELEDKIEEHKREKDDSLFSAKKQFEKNFLITLKGIVGEEDYNWLSTWLMKNKERERQEAEKSQDVKRARELREMGIEDYMLYYFNEPETEKRLRRDIEHSNSEEFQRLSLILTKLELESWRLDGTVV